MTAPGLLADLQHVQTQLRQTGKQLGDHDYRAQFHTDLSPLGWHIGHCAFIETFWLREVVLGDPQVTADLHQLYFPENMPKPERGAALPGMEAHLAWCKNLNHENRELLRTPPRKLREHELSGKDYLCRFLLQHHAQHLETVHMVLQQRALRQNTTGYSVRSPLAAAVNTPATGRLPAGDYRIGNTGSADAFDNEIPAHTVTLRETAIAREPVTNANWLAFMQAGGYETRCYWSEDGWQWLQQAQVDCPEHWLKDTGNNWFGLDDSGPHDLDGNAPVYGINYYEASAFASWLNSEHAAGARLLHEYEWEAAAANGILDNTGQVWEWCANTFHPYAGFTPFPYENYSKPWFDGNHYVLRGGSRYTCDVIKRNSFRNFYNPDKRHIFSGVRLAYD